MPILTLDYLERHVQEEIFQRGQRYYRRGAVLSCEETKEGVQGRVQGSAKRPYRVEISTENEDLSPECNCAYDWDLWCKHAVALALKYLDQKTPPASRKENLLDRVQNLVSFPLPDPVARASGQDTPVAPRRLPPAPGPQPPTSLDLLSLVRSETPSAEQLPPDQEGYRYALEPDPEGLRVYILTPAAGRLRPLKNLQSLIDWYSPYSVNAFGSDARSDRQTDDCDEMVIRYLLQHVTREHEWQRGQREWHFVKYEKVGPLLHLLSCSDAVVDWATRTPIRFPDETLCLVLNVDRKDPEALLVRPVWRSPSGEHPPGTVCIYPSYPGAPSWAWAGNAFYRVRRDAARLAVRLADRQEVEVSGDEIPLLTLRLAKDPPPGVEVILSTEVKTAARRVTPRPVLTMDARRLKVTATLDLDYEGRRISQETPHPYLGPPVQEGEFTVWVERDEEAERAAVERLKACGFARTAEGEWGVDGDAALDFVTLHLTDLSQTWDLYGAEKLKKLQPRTFNFNVSVGFGKGIDWFDVEVECRAGEETFGVAMLARLLASGKKYVRLNDGTYAAIPQERVEQVWKAVADLDVEPSGDNLFRLPAFHAPALLDAIADEGMAQVQDQVRRFVEKLRSFSGIEEVNLPENLQATLRPYQVSGFQWLHFLKDYRLSGILADDMGLGKTLQALTLLQKAKEMEGPMPSLVIAPASVVFNWQAEAARFTPGLTTLPLVGLDRHEQFSQIERSDVIITNYALLRRDIDRLKAIRFRFAILDEAQNIKNPESVTAMASRQLDAHHRLVLTGTPIENRLSELWSIFHFLMPGFLHTYTRFQAEYEKPIQVHGDRESETRLRRRIHPFILRRLKQDVEKDLPEKTETTTYCELLPEQRTLYREVLQTARREVFEKIERQGIQRSHISILSALLRLRQVCCHPRLLNLPVPEERLVSAKFEALTELVQEIVSEGHRILLFSQFVSMLKIIRDWLDSEGIVYEYLDGRTRDRQARVNRFNEDEKVPIFLVSLKAGGTGLNLTGADYVIHYDPWWNPAVEDQATDRAYRIGQTKNVFVYRLITRGTVEEKMIELQKRKRDLAEGVLGVDKVLSKALTPEDIEDLFRLDE
ncbi:MAG: hypothetical protein EXS64_05170 [Candidatus Latescibacteria bacterium]|nr:hypothetical protein [Candidatus Latescibacterota bacterium]